MIKYIDKLYLTPKTERDLNKIKLKLKLGAGMTGLYIIMLSGNPNDVFDIVPAPVFKQRRYRHMDHTVIGMAESQMKAYGIIKKIVLEHYDRTGRYTGLKADFIEVNT